MARARADRGRAGRCLRPDAALAVRDEAGRIDGGEAFTTLTFYQNKEANIRVPVHATWKALPARGRVCGRNVPIPISRRLFCELAVMAPFAISNSIFAHGWPIVSPGESIYNSGRALVSP